MSNAEQITRRSTKLPLASKTIYLNPGSAQSLTIPTDISETSCLSTLKNTLHQCNFNKTDKESILSNLQSHLSILQFFRKEISIEFEKVQHSQSLSIPHRVSQTEIVTFDTPFRNCSTQSRLPSGSTFIQSPLALSRTNSVLLSSNVATSHPQLTSSISQSSLSRQRTLSIDLSNLHSARSNDTAVLDSPTINHHQSNIPLQGSATISGTGNLIGRSNSQSHQKRNESSSESSSNSRTMSALTIWNNVNKFFLVTPTVETFQSKLVPSLPPDPNLPLGPHYSISINQKLKQKYKNGTVQLRLPPEIISDMPEGVMSIIFHRLLSAFVPVFSLESESESNCKSEVHAQPLSANEEENLERHISTSTSISSSISLSDLAVDFKDEGVNSFDPYTSNGYSDLEQYPVNIAGTSMYSMYSFEQKLMLEIQSLGLVPESSSGPKMTDNEVMDEILQKTKELNEVTAETNRLKSEMLDELRKHEKELIDRKEMAKRWGSVTFKPDPGQKKDQKRPKKRDKLI